MKTLLVLVALLFSTTAFSQTSDVRQVEQLIQDSFDEIFSNYNAEKLTDFYTEDFILLEHGEVWDMAFIRNYLGKAKSNPNPPTRTNRFEYIKTIVEGDRAWIAYHNYATISRDGQVLRELYWLESATAIRTENGWRLDMLHSTRSDKKE
ncbi:MAG: nuclear transport factor 2 family protein [Algoriphagus aquaeductus]|uniref:nuclear transport factor 2 family protein n=1 Tax=Algoriphagus aquaeductus TaxID=475299 RepID=UPI00387967F2